MGTAGAKGPLRERERYRSGKHKHTRQGRGAGPGPHPFLFRDGVDPTADGAAAAVRSAVHGHGRAVDGGAHGDRSGQRRCAARPRPRGAPPAGLRGRAGPARPRTPVGRRRRRGGWRRRDEDGARGHAAAAAPCHDHGCCCCCCCTGVQGGSAHRRAGRPCAQLHLLRPWAGASAPHVDLGWRGHGLTRTFGRVTDGR